MDEHEINNLVAYYSRQVSAHVGPVISIFFSLIGLLNLARISDIFEHKLFFSFLYFLLGALGAYFYGRLVYFGQLLDEALLRSSFANLHQQIREQVLQRSLLLRIVSKVSETREGKYRLIWAWLLPIIVSILALVSWIIVFFQL